MGTLAKCPVLLLTHPNAKAFLVKFRTDWKSSSVPVAPISSPDARFHPTCSFSNTFQVMVFVHARNETVRTATVLSEMAKNNGDSRLFEPESGPRYGDALKQV